MHVVHSCHMQATEPQEANAAQPCACQYFECSFAGAASLLNQNVASTTDCAYTQGLLQGLL